MTYTVKFTDSTKSAITIVDNDVDTTTGVNLVGQGYSGYGELIAQNLIYLLEHGADGTAPPKPIEGQIWYDSATKTIKYLDDTVANSGNWKSVASLNAQATSPSGIGEKDGHFWLDINDGQLYVYYNSTWNLIGDTSGISVEAISAEIRTGNDVSGTGAKLYVNPDKMLNVVDYDPGTDGAIDIANDSLWMKDVGASTMSWVSLTDMWNALAPTATPTATTTVSGISELATDTEAALVATTDRVLTPSNLLSTEAGGEIFNKAFDGQLYVTASVPDATASEITALADTNKVFVDGGTGGDAVRVKISDIPFVINNTPSYPPGTHRKTSIHGQTVSDNGTVSTQGLPYPYTFTETGIVEITSGLVFAPVNPGDPNTTGEEVFYLNVTAGDIITKNKINGVTVIAGNMLNAAGQALDATDFLADSGFEFHTYNTITLSSTTNYLSRFVFMELLV